MGMHAPPQDTIEHRVLHDLVYVGRYLQVKHGGHSGQAHLLVKIWRHGGHMTQRELQEQCPITSGALSEVLAKLEAAGQIVRSRAEEDRRTFDIALTEVGENRVATILAERQVFERSCLSCLDEKEKEQLARLLDRVATHWQALEGKEGCA